MRSPLIRAISVAGLGALAGAVAVAITFATHPDFTLEMDRDLPRNVSGVYEPEYIRGAETFVWTARSAKVSLPGFDRRVGWVCTVRLRGGRSAPLTQPTVDLGVDGVTLASGVATNEFEELVAQIPASPRRGLVLTITSSTTVVPGPGDPRELGVQIDRLQCRPEDGTIAWPPRRAYTAGMLAGALFGAAFGLIGLTTGSALAAVVLLTVAQAFPLTSGSAPYNPYADRAPWLALWIAGVMVLTVRAIEWPGRPRLRQAARFVVAFSGAVLYLKLLGILHPSKPLVDAVFQAHRLESVLGGRYYFTQLMPSGVQFPYAIGLYVFAAPWSAFTRDHVMLLRIVVCVTEAIAAASLYPVIVRTWGDRLAGALAVALFTAVPIGYVVIGNANLTNAFGQSIALLTVALVVVWSQRPLRPWHVLVWILLASLALLSHVSTFATLLVTLSALAVLFWRAGGATLLVPARALLLALVAAVAIAITTYYGHFGDVYLKALRVRGGEAPIAAQAQAPPNETPRADLAAEGRARGTGLGVRTAGSLRLVAESLGWPILLMAVAGLWRVSRQARDALVLALCAWGVAFVVFLGVGLMPVESQFERYSLEFVSRVAYAACPAAAILAGAGAAWGWRSGWALRAVSVVLLTLAMIVGLRQWIAWLR
jgi:hypothetical protein